MATATYLETKVYKTSKGNISIPVYEVDANTGVTVVNLRISIYANSPTVIVSNNNGNVLSPIPISTIDNKFSFTVSGTNNQQYNIINNSDSTNFLTNTITVTSGNYRLLVYYFLKTLNNHYILNGYIVNANNKIYDEIIYCTNDSFGVIFDVSHDIDFATSLSLKVNDYYDYFANNSSPSGNTIISLNTNLTTPKAASPLSIPTGVTAETQSGSSLTLDITNSQWYDSTHLEYVTSGTIAKENTSYELYVDVQSEDANIQFESVDEIPLYINGTSASGMSDYHYVNEQNATIDYYFKTGETEDPYEPGGESEPGGGGGNFDEESDFVPEAELPTLGAVSSKMVTLWSPTQTEMNNISSYMNEDNVVEWLRNRFTSIKDAIITFGTMPLSGLVSGSSAEFYFGGLIGSDVYATKLSKQYYSYSCGSLTVNEFWKSYLDYNPYTKVEISLPYVGIIPLDVDYIQSHTLEVVYHMDALSGASQVLLIANGSTIYRYPCNVMNQLPITTTSHSVILNAIMTLTATAAGIALTAGTGAVAGGIAGAGMAAGAMATVPNDIMQGSSGVQDMMGSLKQHVNKSGSLSSNVGYLDEQTPYLIFTRPRQCLPNHQHKFTGYPSLVTMILGSCIGYTVVQDINLSNMSCTSEESKEIIALLKGGVII